MVTVYGLPHLLDPPAEAEQVIVVELVEIADETTLQLPELQRIDETRPEDGAEAASRATK